MDPVHPPSSLSLGSCTEIHSHHFALALWLDLFLFYQFDFHFHFQVQVHQIGDIDNSMDQLLVLPRMLEQQRALVFGLEGWEV
jgi:hypothetical protein